MKRIALLAAALVVFASSGATPRHEPRTTNHESRVLPFDAPYAHCFYDAVPLDGAWEMAYRPWECRWDVRALPRFAGVVVANAVPGYWEDSVAAYRAAGMKDAFRVNPLYVRQTFPITGFANDTTLPDVYGSFYYRRTVVLPHGGAALLAFGGVRNQVHVWINGAFVAFRAGYSTPFELKIPDGVLRKGANEIVLAVSNNPNPGWCGAPVSGLLSRALFSSTGGIEQFLELRFPRNGISDVWVETAPDCASFTVHAAGAAKEFDWTIAQGGKPVAQGSARGDFTLPARGFALWSPEKPVLYELALRQDGRVFRQTFGLRRLVAKGEKLFLNGKPVYLRGVTEHGYFAPSVHLPRDRAYWRTVTAKRKELGFNFVRFHTFVPPAEYLDAADELGMLVHVESPNFVPEPEWTAILAHARRHPSAVIYCTGNETRIDRLTERYLNDVADLVHAHTDALFSPMSALRGVEYALMKNADAVVAKPFAHNAERLARMLPYCDLFTSYQLGATSYSSLDCATPADLDRWGDAYGGKPRLSHEICIDGSYVDLSLEDAYPADSPIRKAGIFSGLRANLAARGLLPRADAYFRNSCAWMARIRKHCFEKLRAADRVAGFDFLGDVNTHWHTFGYSVGMMDEFYRLKPGETVQNVLRYNAAAVVLADLGSDFNVRAGAVKRVAFSLSNYADDAPGGTLHVALVDAADGQVVFSAAPPAADAACGRLTPLGAVDVKIPAVASPRKYFLRASFAGGAVRAENEWEIYAFPEAQNAPAAKGAPRILRGAVSADALLAHLTKGERVLLFGAGPFKSLPATYRIGLAGRTSGNLATVVKRGHPALEGFPDEGWCTWSFRRLMEGAKAVQLEADLPFDPIVDVASSAKFPIRQSFLFEYRVGEGRLLVCSFDFDGKDPAACWLEPRLVAYAGSDRFAPAQKVTPEALRAAIDAPLLTGAPDLNRARNLNDNASEARAGVFAQP